MEMDMNEAMFYGMAEPQDIDPGPEDTPPIREDRIEPY